MNIGLNRKTIYLASRRPNVSIWLYKLWIYHADLEETAPVRHATPDVKIGTITDVALQNPGIRAIELPPTSSIVIGVNEIQSQLSVNAFKSNQNFDSNDLAKYAYNQLVRQSTGSKLVEPIDCNKYIIGNERHAHSLLWGR
jgi:hypothetical protein